MLFLFLSQQSIALEVQRRIFLLRHPKVAFIHRGNVPSLQPSAPHISGVLTLCSGLDGSVPPRRLTQDSAHLRPLCICPHLHTSPLIYDVFPMFYDQMFFFCCYTHSASLRSCRVLFLQQVKPEESVCLLTAWKRRGLPSGEISKQQVASIK